MTICVSRLLVVASGGIKVRCFYVVGMIIYIHAIYVYIVCMLLYVVIRAKYIIVPYHL
jgi:hypothetical protein